MNVEKLKQLKKDAGYTNKMIADDSGVPLGTVQKIFSGETKAPRYKTLKAIEAVLIPASGIISDYVTNDIMTRGSGTAGAKEGMVSADDVRMKGSGTAGVNEGAVSSAASAAVSADVSKSDVSKTNVTDAEGSAYKTTSAKIRKTEMSSDDVQNVNIKGTESLIGNKLLHKLIADDIIFVVRKYIEDNNLSGFVNGSHVGVKLESGDGGIIAPDVSYISSKEMLTRQGITGTPELIVEIMDGETRSNEIGSKPDMYRDCGVKEYWMIDIDAKNIMVYDFVREAFPSMYGFSGKVPVRTLGEDCLVNFAQVYSHLGFLFEG